MNKIANICSCCFLMVACGTQRQVTQSENVMTETRLETVYVTDTVYVDRQQIVQDILTLDTVSVLDNKYARSEASVSAGQLHHRLESKSFKEAIPVQVKTVYRDSIVFVDKYIEKEVEVPAELSGWQKLKLNVGTVTLLAIAILLIYLCAKYIHKH